MRRENRTLRLKEFLSHASRSRSALWKIAIGALVVSAATGLVLGRFRKSEPRLFGERVLASAGLSIGKPDPDGKTDDDPDAIGNGSHPDLITPFRNELANPGLQFADVLQGAPVLAPYVKGEFLSAAREILKKRFGQQRAELICDYMAAWKPANADAYARLKTAASAPSPLRYANYVFGRVEFERYNYSSAYSAFRREAEHEQGNESRWWAVQALVCAKDFATLREVERDPVFAPSITPFVHTEIAAQVKDWRALLKWIPLGQLESYEWSIVTVSLLAGFAWMFFLAHLGEWPSLFSGTAVLCFFGFVLGVLSTTPTLYCVTIEEDILHFTTGREIPGIFAYFIGGVGLREELCKLLLFLPLLPFLLRRGDELEAVIVASFVGLGFAVEENAGYFMNSGASDVAGRFLSANFFHIALTGMNGLALFRAFSQERGGPNDFLYVFPLTVLAHGIYDALLNIPPSAFPGLSDLGGFLPMVVYIVFSMFYFGRVSQLRTNIRMTVGLSGSFVFGISLVMGVVVIYQMMNLGPGAGLSVATSEFLGSAVLVFMFFREFNEQLSC